MAIEYNPKISFIIPTLNSERTLEKCLKSIEVQSYPKEKIEIVIIDGGSTDKTLEIVAHFRGLSPVTYCLVPNPLKTGESGKAIGIDAATGELLAFVDSDNVLVGENWLKKMVLPLRDNTIFASEALRWEYAKEDSTIDRYCALTGINDPICLFLGNYDRLSYLTGKWTGLKVVSEIDKGDYLEVVLDETSVPTMGANGFLLRRHTLKEVNYTPYYFDNDIVFELVKKGFTKIGRPKIGIRHYFCDNTKTYMRKQCRRIRDYFYFKRKKMRTFEHKIKSFKFIKFVIYTLLVFPLLLQSARGFYKKRDRAWFFHPIACWVTFLVYSFATIQNIIDPGMLSREKWRQ
ncbi:MAG: hypothetical protein COS99_07060 [Candidatus Omnitrophica bacterium CG07_land_8_20_14_0_80_42_15]|uniref:Glycosyltransferase 2-like domain-containing protein n=1 Tax=Candidatus Aquitaenariimonas noxiae TaxID=1974741 RepID=A0A2J0KXE1_9BACT|nr:MAG: hypothetical protein COS99_07060 [Candidatus Omnitrophica bacterium CG07_land_8_20_14_0_80_42_15]